MGLKEMVQKIKLLFSGNAPKQLPANNKETNKYGGVFGKNKKIKVDVNLEDEHQEAYRNYKEACDQLDQLIATIEIIANQKTISEDYELSAIARKKEIPATLKVKRIKDKEAEKGPAEKYFSHWKWEENFDKYISKGFKAFIRRRNAEKNGQDPNELGSLSDQEKDVTTLIRLFEEKSKNEGKLMGLEKAVLGHAKEQEEEVAKKISQIEERIGVLKKVSLEQMKKAREEAGLLRETENAENDILDIIMTDAEGREYAPSACVAAHSNSLVVFSYEESLREYEELLQNGAEMPDLENYLIDLGKIIRSTPPFTEYYKEKAIEGNVKREDKAKIGHREHKAIDGSKPKPIEGSKPKPIGWNPKHDDGHGDL